MESRKTRIPLQRKGPETSQAGCRGFESHHPLQIASGPRPVALLSLPPPTSPCALHPEAVTGGTAGALGDV